MDITKAKKILDKLCERYEIPFNELVSDSRLSELVAMRASFTYYAYNNLNMHNGIISRILNRDRTTMYNLLKTVENDKWRYDKNPSRKPLSLVMLDDIHDIEKQNTK